VTRKHQRQTRAATTGLFNELLQPTQRLAMDIMRVINEETDGLLAALHDFHQRPFALFRFACYRLRENV